jgi:hypothetical protein
MKNAFRPALLPSLDVLVLVAIFCLLDGDRVEFTVEFVPLSLDLLPTLVDGRSNIGVDLAPLVARVEEFACPKGNPPFSAPSINPALWDKRLTTGVQ